MSKSRGKLHRARICPWCGTPTLERDYFNPDAASAMGRCVSFVCTNCETGFSLRDSPRAMFVNRMYAAERKQRPLTEEQKQNQQPPLSTRSLDELQRIESVLAAKRPRGRVNRESVAASLAAVRNAIQLKVSDAGQQVFSENGSQGNPLVATREAQGLADVVYATQRTGCEASGTTSRNG